MKKFLQKKPMLLLCALLLFSLGCMGVLAVAEPSKNAGSTAETEVMTEGAVPLGASETGEAVETATPAEARRIDLNAGDGELSETTVPVDEDGNVIGELPVPEREGWIFEGWYTDKVEEVYLSGGDTKGDGVEYTLASEKEIKENLENEVYGTQWESIPGEELLKKHHSWLIGSTGEKVQAGGKIDAEVGTLYAKYKPKTVNVHWNENGWQGSVGALRSSGQYGGYVYTWDRSDSEWGDRVFEGWSFERDGEPVLKNGYVYELGGSYLDFSDGDTIDLYAIWSGGEGRDVKSVEVSIYKDSTHRSLHLPEGWRYFLEYKLLPEEAFDDPVTWSMDPPDAGYFVEQGTKNRMMAVIYTQGASATSVTVTVEASNGVTGSIELPLNHSWNRTYTYQPNCQHTGYAVDVCTVCGVRNQPKFPKTEHTFTSTNTAATCTEPGYQESICKVCGYKEVTNTQPATGHIWGEVKTVSSCEGEVETKTCTVCGYTESDMDKNGAVHQWASTATVDKAPTCSEEGSQSYHCEVCGLTKDSEVIPADPSLHRWTGWTVTKAAQVGVAGERSRRCLTCRQTETETIEALIPSAEEIVSGKYQPETEPDVENNGADIETKPAAPEESTKPEETVSPTEPEKAEDPTKPEAEVKPTEPAKQDETVKPTEPAKPNEAVEPTEPTKPEETEKASEPAKQEEAVEPTEPAKPEETVESTEAAEPADSAKTVKPSEPANSEETVNPSVGGEEKQQENTGAGTEPVTGNTSTGASAGSSSGFGGGSSSSGGSGGGSGSGGSSGGGGGSRGGSGSASKAGAGPAAVTTAAAPLPIVPTEEIREALPDFVEIGSWVEAADGSWTFKDENGETYTNSWAAVYNPYANAAAADAYDWFRFDEAGKLIVGWYVDPTDGNTYYMNPASDGTKGRMMTGWVTIDGKEYYFNPNSDGSRGRMLRNQMTPDGHYVGADGAKVY